MRHPYGQGNGPGWAKRMKANRRSAEHVRTEDERDIGVRKSVGVRLGLDGDRHEFVRARCGCELPATREFRHLAWLRLQRDPETGELPFGVY